MSTEDEIDDDYITVAQKLHNAKAACSHFARFGGCQGSAPEREASRMQKLKELAEEQKNNQANS